MFFIESPRRYVESDVNIHYRCPVRHDPLPLVPERELARQQAEHMKRLYREQRRNKYLQASCISTISTQKYVPRGQHPMVLARGTSYEEQHLYNRLLFIGIFFFYINSYVRNNCMSLSGPYFPSR